MQIKVDHLISKNVMSKSKKTSAIAVWHLANLAMKVIVDSE